MVSVSNNHPFRRTELLIDKGCGGDDWGVSTPFREAVILVVVGASGDDGKLDIHMVGMSGLGLGRCMWWRGISLFSPSAIFDMGKLQMAELPPPLYAWKGGHLEPLISFIRRWEGNHLASWREVRLCGRLSFGRIINMK